MAEKMCLVKDVIPLANIGSQHSYSEVCGRDILSAIEVFEEYTG